MSNTSGGSASNRPIFVVGDEETASALKGQGLSATCDVAGNGDLHLADVVLIPNSNSDLGWQHVNRDGAALSVVAAHVRVLLLPDGSDPVAWFAAGGTLEKWNALVAEAPDWQPPPPDTSQDEAKAAAEAD